MKPGDLVGNDVWGFDFRVLLINGNWVSIINIKTGEFKNVFIESIRVAK